MTARTALTSAPGSVWRLNVTLLFTATLLGWIFGVGSYLLIQSIAMAFAGAIGLWLLYIQHQFKGIYWERDDHWDYTAAALRGSSYYKLPKVLQWMSGNIGFHHIHHLNRAFPTTICSDATKAPRCSSRCRRSR